MPATDVHAIRRAVAALFVTIAMIGALAHLAGVPSPLHIVFASMIGFLAGYLAGETE
jgi:hypothetical protein